MRPAVLTSCLLLSAMPVLAAAAAPAAVSAPRVAIANVAALPLPLPYPFDEHANAAQRVANAFARAKASGKRVLIDFGGNWCPDCRVLSGVMALPEVKAFIDAHYEVVTVDVGMFDRNLAVVRAAGIAKLSGVPTVVVASEDGKPINVANAADLDNARTMTPQGIADWLARWAK